MCVNKSEVSDDTPTRVAWNIPSNWRTVSFATLGKKKSKQNVRSRSSVSLRERLEVGGVQGVLEEDVFTRVAVQGQRAPGRLPQAPREG